MTPERVAGLVGRWVRAYTRSLPSVVAERRIDELEADLYDQITTERAQGIADGQIARSILSRMVRGIGADIAWRWDAARPARPRHRIEDTMNTTTAYRLGLALAVASQLFLLWGVAAMGIVGARGRLLRPAVLRGCRDRRRRRPPRPLPGAGHGRRPDVRWRLPSATITALALILGKQQSPVSSVGEILMVNALFVVLFAVAAWLFRIAARGAHTSSRPGVA